MDVKPLLTRGLLQKNVVDNNEIRVLSTTSHLRKQPDVLAQTSKSQSLMKILLPGIILFLAVGAASSQPRLTNEEYAIYSLVLTDFFHNSNLKNPENPQTHFLIASYAGKFDSLTADSETTSLDRSFNDRNKVRIRLERRFPVAFSYSIVDEKEILNWAGQDAAEYVAKQEQRRRDGKPLIASTCGAGWNRFYARFPKSFGYYRLSRIGFSRNHRQAYLEIKGKGSTWDEDVNYWLKWTKRGWKIQDAGGGFGIC
ncbi:MAG: hypothetical protein IPK98_12360 [Chloracidobacterium sp.]|nr:hypothetical protein [Chloracidobacterium sp.]